MKKLAVIWVLQQMVHTLARVNTRAVLIIIFYLNLYYNMLYYILFILNSVAGRSLPAPPIT
jgi:hypothetical protein